VIGHIIKTPAIKVEKAVLGGNKNDFRTGKMYSLPVPAAKKQPGSPG
jgi:hypothetical protein